VTDTAIPVKYSGRFTDREEGDIDRPWFLGGEPQHRHNALAVSPDADPRVALRAWRHETSTSPAE